MDNASKALIMAGAILISIAIVGVGVYIFSSTSTIGNTAGQQIDATQAQMTNSTLRQYAGTRVKGSQVEEFREYIKVLNTNKTLPIDITYSGEGTTGYIGASDAVTPSAFYKVTLGDSNGDSYYDKVEIKK